MVADIKHFSTSQVIPRSIYQEIPTSFYPASSHMTVESRSTKSVSSHMSKLESTNATKVRLTSVFTSTVKPTSSRNESSGSLTSASIMVLNKSMVTRANSSVLLSACSSSQTSRAIATLTREKEYFAGKLRLTGETFTSDLNNPESETFKTLSSTLEKALEDQLRAEGLQFESVKILSFSQGSVVVNFYVTTLKEIGYQKDNFSKALVEASTSGNGLGGRLFEINPNDFTTMQAKPTTTFISKEGDKGLQKNEEEDDKALIIAVVLCVLLLIGISMVILYIGKKKDWFKRVKRKVLPEQ